jgi:hypothetical protein
MPQKDDSGAARKPLFRVFRAETSPSKYDHGAVTMVLSAKQQGPPYYKPKITGFVVRHHDDLVQLADLDPKTGMPREIVPTFDREIPIPALKKREHLEAIIFVDMRDHGDTFDEIKKLPAEQLFDLTVKDKPDAK